MDAEPPLRILDTPADGVPEVTSTPDALQRVAAALAAGTGPVAVDAERASGHRYGQRAYLVQLRRAGAGTALIDPIALPDLSIVNRAIASAEWILHAANQDLPCLAEVGLAPQQLFDTELGARLAGFARVGLGTIVEQLLGWQLAKEHSAADWSTRPLPEPWLRYAALDVEVLAELRDAIAAELELQQKTQWAQEEFEAVRTTAPPSPRTDPWRRTSGIHGIRHRRQLAAVRELWLARDAVARADDVAPGRVIPDGAIVAAATAAPATAAALRELPGFVGRGARKHQDVWLAALQQAKRVPDLDLPTLHLPHEGPPPPRTWARREPQAARRFQFCRAAMLQLSLDVKVPVENLVAPEAVRRLAWLPPADSDAEVAQFLSGHGARRWQVALCGPVLAQALRQAADPSAPTPEPPRAVAAPEPHEDVTDR